MKARTLLFSIISIAIIGLEGCQSNANKTEVDQTVFVKTEKINTISKSTKMLFNGSVKERRLIDLSFRVGGQISSINVEAGDDVKKGQIIASIDKRDYEIQLSTRKAQYEQVKGEYERYKVLFEEGKLPANAFEKSQSGYLMTKAAFENALNQLNDTELKAPFSGNIYQKKIESFQTVGPGQPIVSLIDNSVLEVVIGVPESSINKIKHSVNNFVSIENASVSNLPVKIHSVSEKAGRDGLFEVKLTFENKKEYDVYAGMSATVTMNCPFKNQSVQIPVASVFTSNNKSYVWVFNENNSSISKKEVIIKSLPGDGKVEVTSGLKNGDIIVTTGVTYLNEGQKVKPIAEPSKTNIGGLL